MTEQKRSAQAPPTMGFRGGPGMGFLQDAPKSKDAKGTLRRLWTYLKRQRGC